MLNKISDSDSDSVYAIKQNNTQFSFVYNRC